MKNILISLCLCLVFLIGCKNDEKVPPPDCGIPAKHLNNEITVQPYNVENTYKQGEGFFFFIILNKDIKIKSSNDFHARIFRFDEKERIWEESTNLATYVGEGIELSAEIPEVLFVIHPTTVNVEKSNRYYVCVAGDIVDNPTQLVGASTFFVLKK